MTTLWQGKTVLIVDDSHTVRDQLTDVYQELGFTIAGVAGNGVEALQQYEILRPDIISLDIVMPEMNGIECLYNLREQDPAIKFLLISVLSSDPEMVQRFKETIPDFHFVAKPATLEKIEFCLRRIFSATDIPQQKVAS